MNAQKYSYDGRIIKNQHQFQIRLLLFSLVLWTFKLTANWEFWLLFRCRNRQLKIYRQKRSRYKVFWQKWTESADT